MSHENGFRFPKRSEQVTIVGRNGSGKTQFATWLLSHTDFDSYPYVIVDYKGDELINDIENIRELGIKEKMPKHPGLYIVHPQTEDDDGITNFLWRLWARENIGLYVDEGYMIKRNNPALNAILTQGRSKNIQRIMLSQRPSQVTRFFISEANHYAVFHLNDDRDNKIIESFLPGTLDERIPEYHCRYYDINADKLFLMQPVPERDSILQRFNDKLKPKRRFF